MGKQLHVIWNPSAGSAQVAEEARTLLEECDGTRFWETASGDDARRAARQAAEQGAEVVVAAGGDGTVNEVVHGLVDHLDTVTLGVLPIGSGNDLARSLGMPLDAVEAAELILDDAPHNCKIDIVDFSTQQRQEGDFYLNMATGGNSGEGLSHLTHEIKQRWGPFCYLRGVIDVAAALKVFQIDLQCDDRLPEDFAALNLFIANGRTSGAGLPAAPAAQLDDGWLDVIIIRDGTPLDLAALTAQFVLSDYLQNELIVYRRARRISIRSAQTLSFTADGELIGAAPATFSIRPRVLSAIVGTHEPAVGRTPAN